MGRPVLEESGQLRLIGARSISQKNCATNFGLAPAPTAHKKAARYASRLTSRQSFPPRPCDEKRPGQEMPARFVRERVHAIRRSVFKIVRQRKQMKGGQGAGRRKVTSTLPFAVRAPGPSSGSVRPMKNQPNLYYQTNPPRGPPLRAKYNQPSRAFFGRPASPWLRSHLASLPSRLILLRPLPLKDARAADSPSYSLPATRRTLRCRPAASRPPSS